jgi:stage III sporulation protein SpoIIIAA
LTAAADIETAVDEITLLVDVLPPRLQAAVRQTDRPDALVEIVMDLGRSPEARYFSRRQVFEGMEVSDADLAHVIARIGDFGEDNRAGIARTLHRISAIRNRKGRIIGLTLRFGRAVRGAADIVRDIIESGRSVLLLGRPGVGKTTMLRETARMLAENKRVIIVDTSNEIAGDGDIPHPAIGAARRMQVAMPSLQHEVMIEAVENHNPEVIVIDEIGREAEALAARTIAERGVQLIATAHGTTLDNLLMNPTLSDLIGGIESVTLSDEEARRRGTQKSVLERRAPPTFDVLIEIQDFYRLVVHPDVSAAVDGLLRDRPTVPELRFVDETGQHVERLTAAVPPGVEGQRTPAVRAAPVERGAAAPVQAPHRTVYLYPYGVSQGRLRQAIKALGVPVVLTEDLPGSDALMTLKSYYRKRPALLVQAEARGVPIYVLRSNTSIQIENALVDLFGLAPRTGALQSAIEEAQEAIRLVHAGTRDMVELAPQEAMVRRQQHELARQANLLSLSRGKDPHRRVRIYRDERSL